jgi:hypothetical protein
MKERETCANCNREIFDSSVMGTYPSQWIHVHSQHRECDRPAVAIPKAASMRPKEGA